MYPGYSFFKIMDKFIVSARKYRPQNFSTVIGQSHITTTLKNAINNNQLAHAFLFCGPRGVGKTTCARILAKTINCESRDKNGEACNKCNSCVSFEKGSSFNIHELDAASNNSVDDIRALVEQVRFAPQAGTYKVYIVDEVHMLSQGAFNAFLKTLEEPPPYAIFILATTEKHKILPTILSRCQIFDFKRITANDTVEHLLEIVKNEKITAEKSALHVIAQKSEGCLRDALSILDKIVSFTSGNLTYANTLEHLNILDEDYYFKLLQQLQQQQLADALMLFDEINQKGFEGDTLLEGFSEFIRNLLVCKDPKSSVLLEVAEDFREKYIEYAKQIKTGWLITALNIINDFAISYKQARNKKLQVELLLIKLSYLNQALELTANDEGMSKKKTVDSIKTVSFKAIPSLTLDKKIPAEKSPETKTTAAAKLIIEEPIKKIETKQAVEPAPIPVSSIESSSTSMGSLNKIRKQIVINNNTSVNEKYLEAESLALAWNQYIDKLNERNNHSAVTNFKLAKTKINDNNHFDIITESVIQLKFIEAETTALIDHLHQFFNNRSIKFRLVIDESKIEQREEIKTISTKELYNTLTDQYPLIKKLKEKLKLEL